jgi:hypothetical protein
MPSDRADAIISRLEPSGAEPSHDDQAASPRGAESSRAGSAPADADAGTGAGEGVASPGATNEPPEVVHAELEAKLANVRDKYKATRLAKQVRERERQVEAERKAVAEERATLTEGRKDFRKFFEANGMNARQAYEEMTRQALEDGKPENLVARMQEQWKTEIQSLAERLEASEKAREEEKAERERQEEERAAGSLEKQFAWDFRECAKDAKYDDLVVEYGEERLFTITQNLRKAWTGEGKSFTMLQLLDELHSLQAKHREGADQRRAARTAAAPTQQAPSAAPARVNGTSERRNGTPLGNDLASARASGDAQKPRTTKAERVQRMISRG